MFPLHFDLGFFLFLSVVSSQDNYSNLSFNDPVYRQPKILLPFVIPPYPFRANEFPRLPCVGTDNRSGICLTQAQCSARLGSAGGYCADNRGVCCVFVKTCGGNAASRVSYFTNVGYPNPFNGGTRCLFTITKQAPFICQLKLDFIDLTLAPPTFEGRCVDDTFSFGDTSLPRLCGENSGLHGYVNFATNCDNHTIIVDTSSSVTFNRKWNIMVTQIPCNSTSRAPRGCLMYYQTTSGTVSSFNFQTAAPPPPPPNTNLGNTNQLLNLNYGVCVRPALGYCNIIWTQSGSNIFTFTISGNTDNQPSQPGSALRGEVCNHNFVVIPNPMVAEAMGTVQPNTDRFCGNALLPVTSMSQPFVLTVVTGPRVEGDAGLDTNNRGFQLDFRQTPCRI